MKKLTFIGTDANVETSLFEYGVIMSTNEHEDGSGTHFVIYRQGEKFGCGHISECEVNELINEPWFDRPNFMRCVDEDSTSWVRLPMITKLHDLLSYYGSENIMGTDYDPMTKQEVRERWLS